MARTIEIARQVTYVTEMLGLSLTLLFFLLNHYRAEVTCFLLIVHHNKRYVKDISNICAPIP